MYTEAATTYLPPASCDTVERIGGSGDGGKRICVDAIRKDDCVV
jgi:hypothetical protein